MNIFSCAFDIDGILLDTATEIWKAVTTHFVLPWSIDKWNRYNISKVVGIPIEDLRPVYEPVLYRNDLPLVGEAGLALKRIFEYSGKPISLITARRPQFIEPARKSLINVIGDNIPLNIYSPMKSKDRLDSEQGNNKLALLKEHGITFFMDDHPDYWEEYIEAGIKIGTFDLPWTREQINSIKDKYTEAQFQVYKDWKDVLDDLCFDGALHKRIYKLAFTGKMGSGKTSASLIALGALTEKYGMDNSIGYVISFAYPLHQCAVALHRKSKPRLFLQRLGDLARREFGDDIFERIFVDNIDGLITNRVPELDKNHILIMTDDLRFLGEYKVAKAMGFTIIRLEADEEIRQRRLDNTFLNTNHRSELEMDQFEPDFVILNNENDPHMVSLSRKITALMNDRILIGD